MNLLSISGKLTCGTLNTQIFHLQLLSGWKRTYMQNRKRGNFLVANMPSVGRDTLKVKHVLHDVRTGLKMINDTFHSNR